MDPSTPRGTSRGQVISPLIPVTQTLKNPIYAPASNGSPPDQEVERIPSRRRRVSAQEAQADFPEQQILPVAPEPPRASHGGPPFSYRDPYASIQGYPQRGPSSFSFAARAGIVQDRGDLQGMVFEDSTDSGRENARKLQDRAHNRAQAPFDTQVSPTSPNGAKLPHRAPSDTDRRAPIARPQDKSPESPEASATQKQSVPPIRTASYRSSGQNRQWAADRSPLQRLEVKLNDISKEEKRARVELAEQKLREREEASGRRASQPFAVPIKQVSTSKRSVSGPSSSSLQAEVSSPSQPRQISVSKDTKSESQQRRSSGADNIRRGETERQTAKTQQVAQQQDQASRKKSVDGSRGEDRGVRFNNQVQDIASEQPRARRTSIGGVDITSQPQSTRQEIMKPDYGKNQDPLVGRGDPVPGHAVRSHQAGLKYEVPPQTAAGIETRKQVGFGSRLDEKTDVPTHDRPHLSDILHRHHGNNATVSSQPGASRHLNEWRTAATARLTLADLKPPKHSPQVDKDTPWWEKNKSSGRGRSNAEADVGTEQADGYFDEQQAVPTSFNPPLFLECGPLLRYTGLKREKLEQPTEMERETWRGSVMIVTLDEQSAYEPAPSLRLFHQPMQLLPPPPRQFDEENGEGLESEYVDPVGGLPKLSRTGGTIYVKPVEDLEEGKDVSRIENDDGIYEETRTANVPTSYGKADELLGLSPHPSHPKSGSQRGGKQVGRYKEVKGFRLHAERGMTFWRFNLEIELGDKQQRIAYRINRGASVGFWVPAQGQTMNMMFHSCNGFSLSVDPNVFSGPDPLWRDVLNAHQTRPFHVMIGGGDQIYNDAAMKETTLFQKWLEIRNPIHKHEEPFTPELRDELESFYLDRYCMWFSQGLFGMASSQIPMINIWDDHDIIDGFGSYPHHFMSTPVFCGLGNVAFKYYMLFQHQSVVDELTSDEPSWLLGASPGPYINELSRSVFMFLGKKVAFLGLDCRTERMRDEILSEASYDTIFERCHREIVKGETKHLIVLLGVPIAYPRLVWLENVLTSRALDPLKALGRMGLLGNFMNKFDGGVEILDDLDDHWTAKNHKDERNWFIEELQELAAEKSVRVTILGGDVHLAAIGQFFSNKKLSIPKDQDFRYMPNIVSSAIVNTPPPDMMADILNKRNKIHHLNAETSEDMIPMFTHDVDGKPRNNKHLLPKRNWCSIAEYHPGTTPSPSLSPTASQESLPPSSPQQRPPGLLQRTLSLGRGDSKPSKLIRRLSLSNKTSSADEISMPYGQNVPSPSSPYAQSSQSQQPTPRYDSAPIPIRPIGNFHRRPTNLSEKAAAKGGAEEEDHHVDLEFGLDISLNCEIKQGDPSGSTEQYRLLVPALLYDGPLPEHKQHKQGFLKRLGSQRKSKASDRNQERGNWGQSDSESESESGSVMHSEDGDLNPPPGRPGTFRRLSGVFSKSGSVLKKKNPRGSAAALEPFKPRPKIIGGAPPIITHPHLQQPPQSSGQSNGQEQPATAWAGTRSPPSAYRESEIQQAPLKMRTAGARPSPQALKAQRDREASRRLSQYGAYERYENQRADSPEPRPRAQAAPSLQTSNIQRSTSQKQQPQSGTPTRAQPRIVPPPSVANTNTAINQTQPLDYASDDVDEFSESEASEVQAPPPQRRGSKFGRGADKFFGEDLAVAEGNAEAAARGGKAGRMLGSPTSPTDVHNGGYSGIEAYSGGGAEKKGWRRFF